MRGDSQIAQVDQAIELVPILPRFDEIDPNAVLVRYDDDGDILHVHFSGQPVPAVIVDVTDCLNLRVDIETNRVVGLQIDDYLGYAVRQDPTLLDLAELAGIDADVIDAARRSITLDRKRAAVLRTILSDVQLAIA